MRRFGEAVKAGIRYRNRPGAYAIVHREGELLATAAFSPTYEIQLPGGGIDPGESPVAALHREVREETGWTIAVERRLGAFQRFTYMPEYDLWARKICHIYLARPVRRLGPPAEPDHLPVWMSVGTAIRELGVEGDRWFVRHHLGS